MLSLIVPIYKNEPNLDRLLKELGQLNSQFGNESLEVVFVVDGSPDRSLEILLDRAPQVFPQVQIAALSRNFGSFNAIAAGLKIGRGDYFAVLAADLQEPPSLVLEFLQVMRSGEADVVFGYRMARNDPWFGELASKVFWKIYRRFVIRDIPEGGVDVFGCTRAVRDRVVTFPEANTNLIVLLFWVGFRRKFIGYRRAPRLEGRSAWTFAKKVRYSVDSIFNFTDLPIRVLIGIGALGTLVAIVYGSIVFVDRLLNKIQVRGYTALMLVILLFGSLTTLGLGILGQYVWLCLQNARRRPNYLIDNVTTYENGQPRPL